jgi:hypothetical protein
MLGSNNWTSEKNYLQIYKKRAIDGDEKTNF